MFLLKFKYSTNLILLSFFFAFISCSKVSESDLIHLNGYWEIEEVKFPDGTTKSYDMNTTVDFIEFSNDSLKGFRKKVQPNLVGSYQTSDHEEGIQLEFKDNTWIIIYTTQFETWEEELIQIKKDKFSVKNQEDKIYSYKRFEPIEL